MKMSCAGALMKFTYIIGFLYDPELSHLVFEKILNPETLLVDSVGV
jgi:hypothetical protein